MNEPYPSKEKERADFFSNFKYAGLVLLSIWAVAGAQTLSPELTSQLGLIPRNTDQLNGIVTMWLVHKDLTHLISNSSPIFLLTLATLMFYPAIGWRVLALSILFGGGLLWCFGREANHIGASGLIYALAAFLFFSGLFRRDRKSIAAALLVAFLYGSLVWGVFPIYKDVSWDGHLFGAIGGLIIALIFRNHGRPVEEDEEEDEFSAINWRPDLPPEGRD